MAADKVFLSDSIISKRAVDFLKYKKNKKKEATFFFFFFLLQVQLLDSIRFHYETFRFCLARRFVAFRVLTCRWRPTSRDRRPVDQSSNFMTRLNHSPKAIFSERQTNKNI